MRRPHDANAHRYAHDRRHDGGIVRKGSIDPCSFGAAVRNAYHRLSPDAVIVQAGSVESAPLIKQADEAGLSLNWIG
ncbi:MAG: hypothetical protein ACXW15_01550 [Acidimicrobiia bacterium]